MKIKVEDYNIPNLRTLLRDANKDTDPASILYFAPNGKEDAEFAVIIVKGREQTKVVANNLEAMKLYTPGKPINPEKTTRGIEYPDQPDDNT